METNFNEITRAVLELLPSRLSRAISSCCPESPIEEIRLRVGRPVQLVTAREDLILCGTSFSMDEARELLEKLCRHSIYSHEDELRNGFLTLSGGSRVGVCGRPVVENGRIVRLTQVSNFNIRITREAIGCAEPVMQHIIEQGMPVSALIAAPPGGGKTTLLRDIARCISNGVGLPPQKVALADERGELAGCIDGAPSFDIGERTDVFELAPKAEAIMTLIRTMSPRVIITDELGGAEDANAVLEAARCGVEVIASAHASSKDELEKRGRLKTLLDAKVFKRILIVKRSGSVLKIFPIRP